MKKAYFLVIDDGVEGQGPSKIVFASSQEKTRDNWLEMHPLKNYYRAEDKVLDLDQVRKNALSKLDGIERLALGIEQRSNERK